MKKPRQEHGNKTIQQLLTELINADKEGELRGTVLETWNSNINGRFINYNWPKI